MGNGENEAVLDIAEFIIGLVTAVSFLTYVASAMDISLTGIIAKDAAYVVDAFIAVPHSFAYIYSFDDEPRRLTLLDGLGVRVADSNSSSLGYITPSTGVSVESKSVYADTYRFKSRMVGEGREVYLDGEGEESMSSFCASFGEPSKDSIQVDEGPQRFTNNEYEGVTGETINVEIKQGEQNKIVYSRLLPKSQQALLCQVFSNIMRTHSSLYFSFEESQSTVEIQVRDEEALDALEIALVEEVVVAE